MTVEISAGLVDLLMQSPALGPTAHVRLLTPDGWAERKPGDHWPVLYLLHCCGDSYVSWTRSTEVADISQLCKQRPRRGA
jgi:hypothetical protein